ncbi:MAG: UrcA family protein [Pseudomonadota bacterium]
MKAFTLALTPILASASIGLAGITAPAFAGETIRKTQTVTAKGLDLNTVEGQKMLEQRVEIAARRVCDYNGRPTATRLRKEERACLAQARANARQQVAALIEDHRRGG